MRQLLLKTAAAVGVLCAFGIVLNKSCNDKSRMGKDAAGVASYQPGNKNENAVATPATPAPSAPSAPSDSIGKPDLAEADDDRARAPDKTIKAKKKRSESSDERVIKQQLALQDQASRRYVDEARRTSEKSEKEAAYMEEIARRSAEERARRSEVSARLREYMMKGEQVERVFSTLPRISDSQLQESIITRVSPSYPPLAREANVRGEVIVQVGIDETGSVIEAKAISGPPLLKDAAVEAARQWKFKPFTIGGSPAKVVGNISFKFDL